MHWNHIVIDPRTALLTEKLGHIQNVGEMGARFNSGGNLLKFISPRGVDISQVQM
jgi:hypothetical protein